MLFLTILVQPFHPFSEGEVQIAELGYTEFAYLFLWMCVCRWLLLTRQQARLLERSALLGGRGNPLFLTGLRGNLGQSNDLAFVRKSAESCIGARAPNTVLLVDLSLSPERSCALTFM
jgi:hypothetical protein